MTDKSGEFIANILKILAQNGFPDKKVALPLDKLYESAHNKNVNFNKVLTFLLEEKDIQHEKTSTKIIFFPQVIEEPISSGHAPGLGFENMEDLMKLGQQMFGNVPNPEQTSEGDLNYANLAEKARNMISSMSPEQIRSLQKLVGDLPNEQKEELIKKAKELGLK